MSDLGVEFYNPGEIIHETTHIAHVIYHRYRNEYCDYCCIRNVKVRLCSKCRYVAYCNSRCQKSAWPDHQLECKRMVLLWAITEHSDILLLVARIIRKLKNEQGKNGEKIGLQEKSVISMPSFTGSRNPMFTPVELRFFMVLNCSLISWFANNELKLENKEIENFSAKIVYNKRSMYYDKEYGMFFYLGINDFKRGCLPNAVDILNSKLTVEIRATQKIRKDGLKNVCLQNNNILSSFSSHVFTSDLIHQNQRCYTCQPHLPILDRLLRDPIAFEVVTTAEALTKLVLGIPNEGDHDPFLRNEVERCINNMKQYESVSQIVVIMRLRLLVWKVLLDRRTLFVVKHWEKSLINMIRSLYGEQSFELYTIYAHLTAIYLEHKKLKFAKQYKAKSDELGALYGLLPHFTDEALKVKTS